MLRYLARRLLMLVPLLVVISVAVFGLVRLAPGGPFDRERAPFTPEIERQLRAKYHLDEPVYLQYARYMAGVLRFDFGPSLRYRGHSVNELIAAAAPVSAVLGLLAFGLALGVGLPLGFVSAAGRGGAGDWAGGFVALVLVCVPGFVIAPVLILVFGLELGWFPPALWGAPAHAVLPTVALGSVYAGRIARLFRGAMLEVMRSEHVLLARAKGLSDTTVLLRHVVRPALIPVASYCGPLLADLLTGSFVIENIFQIPGLGLFFVNGALNNDYTLVMGLVMFYAVLLVVLNLVVDLVYTLLDPRIRYE